MSSEQAPTKPLIRWLSHLLLAIIVVAQIGFSFAGIANYWQWGHNGYNTAAYQVAARNTLRWGTLLPAQYAVGNHEPQPNELYTHAPLALHLHTTAAVAVFGDSEAAVRLTPALMGVAATLALLLIVRRRWGPWHAALAGGVYVLLPINHGLANMANHSTGFIFWSLLALEAYLRWIEQLDPDAAPKTTRPRLALLGLFGAMFMALSWDWPAYYVAFAIALHWLYRSFDPHHRALRHVLGVNREHLLLALFCAFTLASFIGFFAFVHAVVGSFDEMRQSFSSRHATPDDAYARLWTDSLRPMFSTALAMLGLAWTGAFVIRHASGALRGRDLIPASFLLAGVIHTLLFKSTALIHIYWVWPFNPFFALAAATVLLALAAAARRHLTTLLAPRPRGLQLAAAALAALLILAPPLAAYLEHTLPLISEGRRLAGTYNHPGYDPDRLKVDFAHQVNARTTLETGVLLQRNLRHRIEFMAVVDRVNGWTSRVDQIAPPPFPVKDGWVVLGPVRGTPRDQLLNAAAEHPYWQYGLFYMIDHRRQGQDIQIYNLVEEEPGWAWWFFVNPFDKPLKAVRDEAAEARMKQEIETRRRPGAVKRPLPERREGHDATLHP